MLTQPLAQFVAQALPFDLDWLPSNTCLVGGAVRDTLLKRHRDYLDLDFVLPEKAVEIAREIANHYHGGFAVLDEKRRIARVIFEEGTVDFAQQEGETLEIDLKRRDFTINAIAYNPYQHQLIDPLQGVKDIEKGVLRMVSRQNFVEDPLRLLRGYRQAAQLNFTIEKETHTVIQSLAPLIHQVAAERVQSELNYLLKNPDGSPWLKAAWQDNLLSPWLPNITEETFTALAKIDSLYQQFTLINESLDLPFLSKLTLLLSSQSSQAQQELTQLKYSRWEVRNLSKIINYLHSLQQSPDEMTLRETYLLFLDLKDTFPILALSSMALGMAEDLITQLLHHYNNPQDSLAHPQPLLSGHDLIQGLNLKPSPIIGELLIEIHLAYIKGSIKTKDEAIIFAREKLL
ncbi:MAG: CCA tRNA nucleotidyltransferase [Microcystaceae cyanobacterium]